MERNDNISMNREINILDMVYYVVSKWKSVCLAALIFMLLAAAYSYATSGKAIESQQALENNPIELSDTELSNVQAYASYVNNYENLQSYQKDSPWMNMDADSYYEADMQYYIKLNNHEMNEEETSSTQNALVLAYKNALATEEVYTQISEAVGSEVKEEYYSEIIDTDNVLKKKAYNNTLMVNSAGGVLSVTVRHRNDQQVEALVDIVNEAFMAETAKLSSQIHAHKLVLMDNQVVEKNADEIYMHQKNINASIKDVTTRIDEIEKTLTPQQKAYYQQNYVEAKEVADSTEDQNAAPVVVKPSVNKKLAVVGFILGFMLLCGIYVIAYILNSKLMVEDDFERIYGQKLICRVAPDMKDVKMFFLDKFLLKIRRAGLLTFNSTDALPMIVTNIKIACKKNNVSKVVLSSNKIKDQDFLGEISQALKEAGVDAVVGKSVLYDYQTLEKAAEDAMIILFEQAGSSDYLAIQQEIEICRHNGISMIGAVVIAG